MYGNGGKLEERRRAVCNRKINVRLLGGEDRTNINQIKECLSLENLYGIYKLIFNIKL